MIVVSDFDETITTKDTISLILNECNGDSHKYTDYYLNIYKKYKNHYKRILPLIDYNNYLNEIEFQNYCKDNIELLSIDYMIHEKAFNDINSNDLYLLGKKNNILIRDGFNNFLLNNHNNPFYILSINWSKEFINGMINITNMISDIYCNDLLITNSNYNGNFSKKIISGYDKLLKLQDLLINDDKIVYIGDSDTDLLSILSINIIGIIIHINDIKLNYLINLIYGNNNTYINDLLKNYHNNNLQYINLTFNDNIVYIARDWYAINDIINTL